MDDKLVLNRIVELLAVRLESALEKHKRRRVYQRNETDNSSDEASPGPDGEAEEWSGTEESEGEKGNALHQLFVAGEESGPLQRTRRPTSTRPESTRGRGKRGVRRGQSTRREQVKADHVRRKRRT